VPSHLPRVFVEESDKLLHLIGIRADDRMSHLAKELQELVIWAMHEIEAAIREDPVVLPVPVIDAVLEDVAGGVPKSAVRGAHAAQIPDPFQEGNLFKAAVPGNSLHREVVKDVSARELRDGLLSGRCAHIPNLRRRGTPSESVRGGPSR
jgi:hypothetical protein